MNTCYWTLVKTMECTKTRVDLVVNYRILVIMMHQHRFISYDKVATLVGNIDINNKGDWPYMVASVPL